MPKYIHKKRNARRGPRSYVPQVSRMSTVARPLASKYGDELYIKVQRVQELTVDANGDVFSYMRLNGTVSTVDNLQLFD